MEPKKVVFIPDPHLTEGSTKVQDMLRAGRTQSPPTAPAVVAAPTERSVATVPHQPTHDLAPAPRLLPAPSRVPLPRYLHDALDHYEDDLAWVEEVTRTAAQSVSRTYLENSWITQRTLELDYRSRERIGFADAEEKAYWQRGRHRYQQDMDDIAAEASYAVRARLRTALDCPPEPPPPPGFLATLRAELRRR